MTTLFEAFHDDHAVLGKAFHAISTQLRGGDVTAARGIAERLDRDAGPHIAFEEEAFYPALRKLFGDEDVDRFYHEHDEGLVVLQALLQPDKREMSSTACAELLRQSEAMEVHIAECGELFEAMGRMPLAEQAALFQELLAWREKAPRWTEFAAHKTDGGA